MKTFACSVLVILALADKSDFPKDDSFHADCHVSATFDGSSCDAVYKAMD
eukprot:CAMPEP_0170468666 /NCGR_PEP_ID=MMETSP0123-20130129/11758_1 /TAXON_ID=182087 /ORGANISM="Favella ehrenbergii, Strain Fehren 1" /LENGTH=49 /DNA_ID=CAMNT_0010735287 /DNA_START=12 /DNA_END=161 /DNA_ORIENTATION=-